MRARIAALMLRSVLVCGVLCAGAQGRDSKWELVNTRQASDADGNEYFVDTANLRFTEAPITVNVLVQFRDVQTDLESDYEIRSSTRLSAFDCPRRRFAPMAITFYSGDRSTGNVVRWMDLARDQWAEVTPKSVYEAILTFVCSRAPKQAR